MLYDVFVDNDLEEEALELDEAQELLEEILEECPEVTVRLEPTKGEEGDEEEEEDLEEDEEDEEKY